MEQILLMMYQVLIMIQNTISKLKNYNIPKVLHHMQGNTKYYAKKSKI